MADESLIGQRIGQYQITREIGRGGMGIVYEAVHAVIGQRVAVKTLSAALLDPGRGKEQRSLARFLSEARAGSLIEHEGVPRIFDYGQLASGTPYILMELLKGEMLRARLDRTPGRRLTVADAMRITRQIAAAMCAAHEKGVLHRDLKPENIILIPDSEAPGGERAKVLDFGIAHFLTEDAAASGPLSAPLGTPAYMSPERCLGEVAPNPRTDVYSLGIILYEMLLGAPPFTGIREEILRRQIFEQAIPLHSRLPELPESLDTLVSRMLAKSSGMRPPMTEVHVVLSELTAGAPSGEQPRRLPPSAMTHQGQPTESADGALAARPTAAPTPAGARSQHLVLLPSTRRLLWYAGLAVVVTAGLGPALERLSRSGNRLVQQLSGGRYTLYSTLHETEAARERARWLNSLGDKAHDAQRYDEAIRHFRQAIALDPAYGQAYSNLAVSYYRTHRRTEAISANQKALDLATGPTANNLRAASYYNLARIYEDSKDFADALKYYQLAQAERPIYTESIERLKAKQN